MVQNLIDEIMALDKVVWYGYDEDEGSRVAYGQAKWLLEYYLRFLEREVA